MTPRVHDHQVHRRRGAGRPAKGSGSDARTDILEAAERLFATFGYESTSISAIATEVGVAPNTVTYHFGSKRDLWLLIHSQTTEDFWGQYRSAFDGRSLLDVVREVLEVTFRVRDEHPYHAHFRYRATGDALLHPDLMYVTGVKSDVQTAFFRDLAEYGWQTGSLTRFESVESAATFLRYVILGFFYTCHTLGRDGPEMIDSVLESLAPAITV